MSIYPIVDTRTWERLEVEDMGTKAKVWLVGPDGWRWLFKQNRADDQGERGEDWAEKIASEVAHLLEVPAATVELARDDFQEGPPNGVVSRHIVQASERVAPAGRLVHGNELLRGLMPDYPSSQRGSVDRYTLERCHAVLDRFTTDPAGPAPSNSTAWFDFTGQLLLDAVIANTDRHHENWAVVERPGETPYMAPSFDHASSLGFNTRQEEKQRRAIEESVDVWVARGRTKFAERPTMVQAAKLAMAMLSGDEREVWRERLRGVDSGELTAIVDAVPHERMSQADRTFACSIMAINLEELCRDD